MKEKHSTLHTETVEDFEFILQLLIEKRHDQPFEPFKVKLPPLINTAEDFNRAYRHLSEEQRAELFDGSLKTKLPELVNTASDCGLIFQFLSEKQRNELFECLKAKIPTLITFAIEFAFICQVLTEKQCYELFECLKTYLPERIETAPDFQLVCQFLTEAQRNELFESLKIKLPHFIHTAADFFCTFYYLSKAHHTELVNGSLKKKLPTLIKTASDFSLIFQFLTEKQCDELFASFEETQPEFFNSKVEYDMLAFLSEEKRQLFKEQRQATAQVSFNGVQTKTLQLNKGFTRLFFKDISHQKRLILCRMAELAKTILQHQNHVENRVRLEEIKKIAQDNQAILKTHRGFFKLHETTSNQLADALVDRLECLVAVNCC